MTSFCINYNTCPLINDPGFLQVKEKTDYYVETFCKGGKENWSICKRYLMKLRWNFCPDFVLPDTPDTTDEILDKFEEE